MPHCTFVVSLGMVRIAGRHLRLAALALRSHCLDHTMRLEAVVTYGSASPWAAESGAFRQRRGVPAPVEAAPSAARGAHTMLADTATYAHRGVRRSLVARVIHIGL